MPIDAATRRSIYVVADDESLIRALAEHRKPDAGWRFVAPAGPPEPDALVILDLEDEAERRRTNLRLRSDGHAGPLLILGDASAAGSPDDEPVGRPVKLGVLLARIDAHAADPEGGGSCQLGPYAFDRADRELRHRFEDGAIRLTELECKLLACLVESRGAVIGRDQLLARVWGYSAGVATHTVETHVWRLRQKIETEDPATRFLVTEPGGYRLVVADCEPPS
jgi:DNA-binding winged helix-turn-helix (wHTH) protein